jgi:Tol biopolymer transport system component
MPLAAGTKIGPYVVDVPIGAGGMGEVYRARDTKLNRDVALKILPSAFAQDRERLARFEREAQVLAKLNHTHIAQVHGLEELDGAPALVMELVEGPTLEERLNATGALPLDEALAIARQVADALEAAHEQGIVHRDLKPANIKVRPDGTVKVLDFGLAKALDNTTGSGDLNLANSPTITTPAMTTHGMILGTAAYMSPEQARGKPVDKRADIWAFGLVLFEMLTGRSGFAGETVTDTLAAVVTRDPEWSALPPATPPHVRRLLARCLIKDPRQRLRDVGDARLELDPQAHAATAPPPDTRPAASAWARRIPWVIAAGSLGLAAAVMLRPDVQPVDGGAARPTRFVVMPPESGALDVPGTMRTSGAVSLSPDGRRLAFLSTAPGGRLWIRDLASAEPTLIKGTEGAQLPFWSPDGRTLGFFGATGLRKIDLDTGTVHAVAGGTVTGPRGATFNQAGTILFTDDTRRGIQRIMAGSTTAQMTTSLDASRGDRNHLWPTFLPDGKRFLFLVMTNEDATTGIYAGSLESKESRFVTQADSNVSYIHPGWLLFMRASVLLAQPFDVERGVTTGEPVTIVQQVAYNQTNRRGEFTASNTGVLAYALGGANTVRLAWFDRSGKNIGEVSGNGHMDISFDDTRVVADRFDPQNGMRDVWVFDQTRGAQTRLTFSPVNDWVPVFSPDAATVVFTSDRDTPNVAQLYQKATNGSGREELLLKTNSAKHHLDWSPDGRFLAFEQNGAEGVPDLWMLPMTGDRQAVPVMESPFREAQPSFSPDSKLLGYTSNESGVFEVYVQTFPLSGGKWQISTSGGTQPQWRRDGKEMYYLAADGKIMVVDVDLQKPSFGVPRALFQSSIAGDSTTEHYAVTSDGQRFLMQDSATLVRGFTVVLNWMADLRK